MGRFVNADALVSTGQGVLGNNMFAYCLNNPVTNFDASGGLCQPAMIQYLGGGANYITDQNAEPYASQKLGGYTVSYNGCGAIATYNALLSLGEYVPFSDILTYYNGSPFRTFLNGKFGILPSQVAYYFTSMGYKTALVYTSDELDAYSANADACIMYYMFPSDYSFLGVALPYAHFVEYSKGEQGYIGRNTNNTTGTEIFMYPSTYGYQYPGYYAVGILIYNI